MVVTMANSGMPLSAAPNNALPAGQPVPPNYLENGRLYHGFRRGKYMFPCDEQEMDRLDIWHKFFTVARKDAIHFLHSIPFVVNYDAGPRILDLGTGTGIWAIDMADQYHKQEPEVVGIDLVYIQPAQIPPNLTFHIRDIESPWHGMDLDSWDLIHLRMLNGSMTSWPATYQTIFRHLKPDYGWMEQVEIDFEPRCDDNTIPPNSTFVTWYNLLVEATATAARPIAYNHNTRSTLRAAGFVDIQEQIIQAPVNSWSPNPQLKEVGRWFNLGLTQGLEALTLAPLTRVLHWSPQDVGGLIDGVKREICSKRYHMYCNLHIWTARRPARSG